MAAPLPGGFRVVLDRRARRLDDLVGDAGGVAAAAVPALAGRGSRPLHRLIAGATVEGGVAGGRCGRRAPGADPGRRGHPAPEAPGRVRPRPGGRGHPRAGPGQHPAPGAGRARGRAAGGGRRRRLGRRQRCRRPAARGRGDPPRPPEDRRRPATAVCEQSAPSYALVDSDCVPEPDWLEALLPHLADPAVAAVAPRMAASARHRLGPCPVRVGTVGGRPRRLRGPGGVALEGRLHPNGGDDGPSPGGAGRRRLR